MMTADTFPAELPADFVEPLPAITLEDHAAQVACYGQRVLYVTARHVSPRYAFDAEPMTVRATFGEGGAVFYYATHARLGCGRNAPSPAAACITLASAAGCYQIDVREPYGRRADLTPPLPPRQMQTVLRNRERAERAERERFSADRLTRCTNSEPGWFNGECGKAPSYIGTHRNGHRQAFCAACRADGYEARTVATWERVA